jgi:hypothetical protein
VTESEWITIAVLSFLSLLAVLALVRVLIRHDAPLRRLRVGVFVERDPQQQIIHERGHDE